MILGFLDMEQKSYGVFAAYLGLTGENIIH